MRKIKLFNGLLNKIRGILRFFKIDFSFFIMFVIAFFLEEITFFIAFVVFLILHELSHFFMAKKLGYYAKQIRLNFFGASLEGLDDFLLLDEIKIILAGPLLNLSVVILCYLSYWFCPESYHYLNEIQTVNWALFLFNFLPIYPLDLGRIIHALLSKKYNRKDALKYTKIISLVVIIILFILFLISFFFDFNFTFGFVIVNLTFLLFSSAKDTSYKRQLFAERKYKLIKKGLVERNIYVDLNMKPYAMFKFIDDYHFVNFFMLNEKFEVVNSISEVELYEKLGLI